MPHPANRPRIFRRPRLFRTALLAIAVAAGLLLAACGGKSGTGSTSTNAAAASAVAPKARAAALRTCLQKYGITLPAPTQRPSRTTPDGQPPNGQPRRLFELPKGVTRAKLQEAMKKCGGGFGRAGGFAAQRDPQALAKFAACMRTNGIDLPKPDTTGKGPVFDTSGIDTRSAKFRNAESKCRSKLGGPRGGLPGGPGSGGPGGPGGYGPGAYGHRGGYGTPPEGPPPA
jgi:hypothetical protein